MLLSQVRQMLIKHLWQNYRNQMLSIQQIETALQQKGMDCLFLDHFAIIDLPGKNTGIPYLNQLFSTLGYITQGKDYLPCKQNDFMWMREVDCLNKMATTVLPQVVIADFRLAALPHHIRKIIEKYAAQAQPLPIKNIDHLVNLVIINHDMLAAQQLISLIKQYLSGRDWPLPSLSEFYHVQEFNELLAWVLVFGRKPNHFALSTHLLTDFIDFKQFNNFIKNELSLELNQEGGLIKGRPAIGIAQSSTLGSKQIIQLSDGKAELRSEFIEFVWRYPRDPNAGKQKNRLWKDFFTGFIANNANQVIESLF